MTDATARIVRALDFLQASPLVTAREPLRGAPPSAIADLEASLGLEVPPSLREFMLRAGERAGSFMRGSELKLAELKGINAAAQEMMSSAGSPLPSGALVFLMHQGYQFLFVDATAGDSPVFHGDETGRIDLVADNFAAWLESAIEDELGAEAALRS